MRNNKDFGTFLNDFGTFLNWFGTFLNDFKSGANVAGIFSIGKDIFSCCEGKIFEKCEKKPQTRKKSLNSLRWD
jgi:hypothetical protein